jgi:hypothetical protein
MNQDWFWTQKWQQGEQEADEDIINKNGTYYYSDEEFFESLK